MKITFDLPNDDREHRYCMQCQQEGVTPVIRKGRELHACAHCKHVDERALIIDPKVIWWLGSDGEYWHEVAGVFVLNERDEMLFFDRTRFPFGLTPPAGHMDKGEKPAIAARRELREETGIDLPVKRFVHAVTANVVGDSCRRGCDAHRWHAFVARVSSDVRVRVDKNEGVRPTWLTLGQALACRGLTFVTRYMLENHGNTIVRA
jgi:8-oxo-dGTP pyrophosphatase MutT (NUDIX family)